MAEREPFTFDDVDTATRDVLIVARSLLDAALATVVRLGLDRAAVVNMGLDDAREAHHG